MSFDKFLLAEAQQQIKYLKMQLKAKDSPINIFPELTPEQRAENKEIVELTFQLEKAQEENKDLQSRYIELQKDHAKCMAQRDKLLLENSKLKEKISKGDK